MLKTNKKKQKLLIRLECTDQFFQTKVHCSWRRGAIRNITWPPRTHKLKKRRRKRILRERSSLCNSNVRALSIANQRLSHLNTLKVYPYYNEKYPQDLPTGFKHRDASQCLRRRFFLPPSCHYDDKEDRLKRPK